MLRLLIVNDNLEFATTLFNYIKEKNGNGYIVINIANNGQNAYKYLTQNLPDAILLNLNIPRLSRTDLILEF